MKSLAATILSFCLLQGCASLSTSGTIEAKMAAVDQLQNELATEFASVVRSYCRHVDPLVRQAIRQRINSFAQPDSIQITCKLAK